MNDTDKQKLFKKIDNLKFDKTKPYLYVIKLIGNKYYIGISKNKLQQRLRRHLKQKKCAMYTKENQMIDIVEIQELTELFQEDYVTMKYMEKYGIENVRGGSFTKPILDTASIKILKKMIYTQQDKCFVCGKEHFIRNCPIKYEVDYADFRIEKDIATQSINLDKSIKIDNSFNVNNYNFINCSIL